jgi:predicted O-methyltransferase YrrM
VGTGSFLAVLPSSPAELVAGVIADPPLAHPDAPGGVWNTDADCYELIATRIGPGSRTIETGCGVSTALFAALGAQHVCVTPYETEADAVRAWCRRHDVPLDDLTFLLGSSFDVLPALEPVPYDLVFIDGEHHHPAPTIDWYYAARGLQLGGVVVVDDVQLPAPRLVADYLESLASFRTLARTPKWAALELASVPRPSTEWRFPSAGRVLIPGGRLERAGRKLDHLLSRRGRV